MRFTVLDLYTCYNFVTCKLFQRGVSNMTQPAVPQITIRHCYNIHLSQHFGSLRSSLHDVQITTFDATGDGYTPN